MSSSKKRDTGVGRGRGRPRTFDESTALDAAMLAFWRNGFHGTSLDDLVTATSMPRASLYAVFGDKRDLLVAALELYARQFAGRVDAIMAAEPDGRSALRRVLEASADRLSGDAAPQGCLRCRMTLELLGHDPIIDRALDSANASYRETIQRLVARSVENGQISAARAAGLPDFVTAILNGMVLLSQSGRGRAELNGVIALALSAWKEHQA